jgi:hypothetical protein
MSKQLPNKIERTPGKNQRNYGTTRQAFVYSWILMVFGLNSVKMPESIMNWNRPGSDQLKRGAAHATVWCDLQKPTKIFIRVVSVQAET